MLTVPDETRVLPEPKLPSRAAIPAFPFIAFVGGKKNVQSNCYRHKWHNHINIITLVNFEKPFNPDYFLYTPTKRKFSTVVQRKVSRYAFTLKKRRFTLTLDLFPKTLYTSHTFKFLQGA